MVEIMLGGLLQYIVVCRVWLANEPMQSLIPNVEGINWFEIPPYQIRFGFKDDPGMARMDLKKRWSEVGRFCYARDHAFVALRQVSDATS